MGLVCNGPLGHTRIFCHSAFAISIRPRRINVEKEEIVDVNIFVKMFISMMNKMLEKQMYPIHLKG